MPYNRGMITNPTGKYLEEIARNRAIVALADLDLGLSLRQIAQQFHLAQSRISAILHRAGLPPRKRGWPKGRPRKTPK